MAYNLREALQAKQAEIERELGVSLVDSTGAAPYQPIYKEKDSKMATLEDHIETIQRYVHHGLEPGSGTRAVLENNLEQSLSRLDVTSLLILPDIVRYLRSNVFPECWGSREKVDAWIRKKREEREAIGKALERL